MSIPTWTFQDRIRKAREHAGLKQDELAQLLGVARNTLNRWENGSTNPSENTIILLSEATGIPLSWFYQDDTTPASTSLSPDLLPPGSMVTWTPDGLQVVKSTR